MAGNEYMYIFRDGQDIRSSPMVLKRWIEGMSTRGRGVFNVHNRKVTLKVRRARRVVAIRNVLATVCDP